MSPSKKASKGRTKRAPKAAAAKRAPRKPRKRAARKASAAGSGLEVAKAGAWPAWVAPWLEALERRRSVTLACETISIGRRTVYDLREKDDDFRRAWDAARYTWRDDAETSAVTWAIEGLPEPVFGRVEVRDEDGFVIEVRQEVIGVRMKKNASVTMGVLAALDPERYGKGATEGDPHEAARMIRDDLQLMMGGVPTRPPEGLEPHLIEPIDPSLEPVPPGKARKLGAAGHEMPAPKRRAKEHEPEPPPA